MGANCLRCRCAPIHVGTRRTVAPPIDYNWHIRSALTTWIALATCFAVGMHGTLRAGALRSRFSLTVVSFLGGYVLFSLFVVALFFTVILNDAAKLHLFRM